MLGRETPIIREAKRIQDVVTPPQKIDEERSDNRRGKREEVVKFSIMKSVGCLRGEVEPG